MLKTVAELIAELSKFPPDAEVKALWDCMPDFDIHRVEVLNGVVIIDCGDGDGDWEDITSE